jgi:hypothetical protein
MNESNIVPTDDEFILDKMLSDDGNKKEVRDLDVLKELFTKKDIESKTELSVGQVILMNQKRTIAKLLDWESLDNCLNDFMVLMVSKDRRGRAEFVDGFKSERETAIKGQTGFFGEIGKKLQGKQ